MNFNIEILRLRLRMTKRNVTLSTFTSFSVNSAKSLIYIRRDYGEFPKAL